MKKTKKFLALCLCSTVVTANISPITIEAKTSAKVVAAPCAVSNMMTGVLEKLQPQNMHAFATTTDGFTYDTNGVNTITITGYEGSDTDLVIPETIDGYTVTKIGEYAFEYNTKLNSITFPDSLTTIEQYAFNNCTNLKAVKMPDAVTKIESRAFSFCYSLATVELSSNLTTLGFRAFFNCSALESIAIPKSLTTYDGTTSGPFAGCTSLRTATIEEGTKKICASLFFDCGIESITIPDTVTEIGESAFFGCVNLKTVDIPDTVTMIGNKAFNSCSGLTTVELSSNLTTLGFEAFGDCTALSSIVIPKSLTAYNYAYGPFTGCTHLYTATIEEGATKVCKRLFENSAVEIVNIPSTITSVEEDAFNKCTNLKSIYFSCNAPKIAEDAFTSVTATAYYPVNNSTWTSNIRQNYGGTLTWETWTPAVTPAPVVTQKPTPTVAPITNTTVTKVTASTSKKKVILRWKKKSNVTGYQIYKKTGKGKYKLVKTIKKSNTVKWTDKSVKSGKTYYYKIRAYKVASKKKSYSKFSSVKKVKVK